MRNNKTYIISVCMVICFITAYLPVTNSWYLSLNGRLDLSRLVISAVKINGHLDEKTTSKKRKQAIEAVFNELKIATGKIKVEQNNDKQAISLIEIQPEYPVLKTTALLSFHYDYFSLIIYKNNYYQIDQFPPELPPPEHKLVS